MNQHIIKLVRRALNECVSTPVESVIASRIDDHGIVEIPNTFAEKFAELIVRECVKSTIALQNTAIDNEWHLDETFHIIVDDMVEQFDMQHIFRS